MTILRGGERFPLYHGRNGVPDPWITRYCAVELRTAGLSVNTIARAAKAVALLLDWAAARSVDITARIESGDFFTHEESLDLSNWLRRSRARAKADGTVKAVVDANTHENRVSCVRSYIRWRGEIAVHRIPVASGRYGDGSKKLAAWDRMMSGLARGGTTKKRYGLTDEQRALFLRIIHPDADGNPFDRHHRHRNYAILLAYYELGLRRGEPFVLKSGDLRISGATPKLAVRARPDDPDDPRPDQPLVKTAERLLPVGAELLGALDTWILRNRSDKDRYPGAKKHPFVFVSENGRPMALRTVYDLFVKMRERYPELPRDFSPHILRHDWNDRFSALCDRRREADALANVPQSHRLTKAKEESVRNYLMGWKKHSKRAATYTNRSTEATASELMLTLQDRSTNG
ncbi:tyrosine-type recombinase/integrase [Aureimonas flava]|uniref:tyrosine-type recombinase/integrase n=1 Tax=Aureimonas flava TaxID=2320271 RepID=UPI001FE0BC1D|nr:site-specific integrase [Aureimonas flava]